MFYRYLKFIPKKPNYILKVDFGKFQIKKIKIVDKIEKKDKIVFLLEEGSGVFNDKITIKTTSLYGVSIKNNIFFTKNSAVKAMARYFKKSQQNREIYIKDYENLEKFLMEYPHKVI